MDRNELIEKAKKFWAERANQLAGQSSTRAEAMADFVLSLEAKDEWPQYGDEYWYIDDEEVVDGTWTDHQLDHIRRDRGIVFRTEAEANLADRQRIARTAIHRWIAENAERVDWTDGECKCYPLLNVDSGRWNLDWWTGNRIPDWFYVYEKDYARMMAENAEHFEVLKEGME